MKSTRFSKRASRRRTAQVLAGSIAALVAVLAFHSTAFSASQTWTGATANWSTATNWTNNLLPGSNANAQNNDVATFTLAGAATPVLMDTTTLNIGGITFNGAGAFTIGTNAGNALFLSSIGSAFGTHSINITSAGTASQVIAAPLKFTAPSSTNGSFGFVNNATNSAVTLTLSGAMTMASSASRPTTMVLDGTNTGANTISGAITSAGQGQLVPLMVKRGAGTWTLTAANAFTGTAMTDTATTNYGIQILDGTLVAANNSALGTSGTANANQVYIGNKSTTWTYNGTLTNIYTSVAGGTLQIANGITLDNGLSLNLINGGTIQGVGAAATNSRINVSTAATGVTISTLNAADVFTIGNGSNDFAGGTAGTTVTTISGAGTVLLAQASNYAGSLSVGNGSTLQINSDTALGTVTTANVTLLGNGKLQIGSTANRAPTVVGLISASATAVVESNFAGANLLTVNNASTNTYAGILRNGTAGILALTKGAAGVLTLSGTNTYTGATTIGLGTLNVTGSLGTSAVAVNNGGTLAGGNTAGTLGILGGAVAVASGGHIAPGNGGNGTAGIVTVGSLTLGIGSQLDYDITNASTLDLITVSNSGGLAINGGQLNINGGTGLFTANGVYNLIGYTGAIGGAVTNLSVNGSNQDLANKSYSFNSNGSFVTLTIANAAVSASFYNADADGNWSTGPWTVGTPNAVGAFAAFGGGGTEITANRTIVVDGTFTVGTISLNGAANSKTYTLAAGGGSLTLDNGATAAALTNTASSNTIASSVILTANGVTTTVTSAADTLTLSGVVSGTGAITKAGAGKLALTGANTFVGNTTINAGTLQINSVNSVGDAANTVTINNATLQAIENITTTRNITLGDAASVISVDATKTYSVGGVVSGSGALNKTGSGTLALTGTNTYTGGTNLNAGTLAINTDSSLGDAAGVTAINAAILETTANITTTRAITLATAASTILTDAATTYSVGGLISGTGSLNKTGAGTLALTNGGNTYSGATVFGGGTLSLNSGADGGTGGIGTGAIVFQGGTLASNYGSSTTLVISNAISVASGQNGTINTPQRVRLNGAVSGAGTLNLVINSPISRNDFQNNFSGFTGNLNITGTGTIRLGIVSLGTGQPNFNSAGWASTTMSLDGVTLAPTTNSGGNTILIGTLTSTSTAGVLAGGTAGTATYSIGALNAPASAYGGTITGNAALTKTGTGTLTLTGANTYTGATLISTGTLQIGNAGSTGTLGNLGLVTNNASLIFNRSDTAYTVPNGINGTGTVGIQGGGKITFTAPNGYTGLTTISGGSTLNINGQFALGGSVYGGLTFGTGGGTLQYATAFSGNGSGDISQDAGGTAKSVTFTGTATVDTNGNDVTYANTIGNSGAGGLTKIGAGTLSLNGANNYTGATLISVGTLQLGSGATTGSLSASSAITNNATLAFNRSNTLTQGTEFAATISGTGGVNQVGAGTTILNGTNTYAGATLISAGTLQLGDGGTTGSLATGSTITTNGTLAFNRSNALVQGTDFAAGITGTGGVTQAGSGTTTLNSTNAYTGVTAVSNGTLLVSGSLSATTTVNITAGTLLLGASNVINDAAAVNLGGGTFNTGGFSETLGALTLSATSTIDFGAGNANELTFTTLTLGSNNLNIWNWTATNLPINADGGTAGDGLRDRLLFTTLGTLSAGELSQIHFFSDAGSTGLGDGRQISFGANQELVPVPEPTTILGALALVGLVGYRERRRLAAVLRRA